MCTETHTRVSVDMNAYKHLCMPVYLCVYARMCARAPYRVGSHAFVLGSCAKSEKRCEERCNKKAQQQLQSKRTKVCHFAKFA